MTVEAPLAPALDYEKLLNQRGRVIWLYGLSGSGKSTVSEALATTLYHRGFYAMILDGDAVRGTINRDLGFKPEDRNENLRRTAELARFLALRGVIVIVGFITPFRESRAMIRGILGEVPNDLIFMNAGLATCRKRDPKGIYQAHRDGKIKELTGVDASFEIGPHDYELNTETQDSLESLHDLLDYLKIPEKKTR